jgi:elongation factor 1-alpha
MMNEVKIGFVGNVDAGKCLGFNTPVMMYDGNLKMVQDIKVGDLLMGDDSTSRKVLSTTKGRGQMYKIVPDNGDSYIVNDRHVLSLKSEEGKIIDIEITEFLKLDKDIQKLYKGYRVPVEFPNKVDRKIFNPKISHRDVLLNNIKIESIGEDDYYGFTLDGNHRFLLGDCTVTHNSSTIGVLAYDVLDDGRGLARSKVLQFPHEKTSGRTSSVSKHFVQKPERNTFYSLLDLAGHEKYLRTTLYGLSGHSVDYAVLIVGGNMGVSHMTKEHLGILLPMRIPFIVVVTKIDMTPPNILAETLKDIQEIIQKKRSPQRDCVLINNMDDVKSTLEVFDEKKYKICPIFQISNTHVDMDMNDIKVNKLDLLKEFIFNLKPRFTELYKSLGMESNMIFKIYDKFYVNGIGIVLSGYVRRGHLKVGDKFYLGPIQGDWKEVVIRSIHDNFKNIIPSLSAGESGCVAIKFTDKKYKVSKKTIKKGVVLSNKTKFYTDFYADIYILSSNNTTMKVGYQPVINCSTIVQTAKILELDKEIVRGGEKVRAKMSFMHRPEYFEEGELFVFREGNLKGFGKIIQLIEK